MAEQGFRRMLRWAFLMGLGLYASTGFPVELGTMEVRSEVGMPLIAHVQFEMNAQEAQHPEQVSIVLKSTSVADYKGLVRTRLFLQPNSTSGFLRITAIQAAPRGLVLVLEAQDSRQNHIREYVVDSNVVRIRDIQRPELPPAVAHSSSTVSAPVVVSPSARLEPAPPDGIELRLLDQTQSDEIVSPRALASDLALLNRTQANLLDDELAQKQAVDALGVLRGVLQKAGGLFAVKASREVVSAAMEEEKPVGPDSYVLTIEAHTVKEKESSPAMPSASDRQGEVGLTESVSVAESVSQAGVAKQDNRAVLDPIEESPSSVSVQSLDSRSTSLLWIVLSLGSTVLGVLFWFSTLRRKHIEQEESEVQTQSEIPANASVTVAQNPEGLPVKEEPLMNLSEPLLREPSITINRSSAHSHHPDFDVDATFEAEPIVKAFSFDDGGQVEMQDLSERITDHEPPFKNENDARIELAGAYLEIEDFEVAAKVLEGMDGKLTPEQQRRLEKLREEIMQGEARP